MAHSFIAYIDESGDEGWSFRDQPGEGSSEWFVISALIVPRPREMEELKKFHAAIRPIEDMRRSPIHFSKLNHEQRVAVCASIGQSGFRTISIIVNKRLIERDGLKGKWRLYFYATRYLLERVSWLARDDNKDAWGDGRVRLIFSNRRQMSYEDLKGYLDRLRGAPAAEDIRIHWPAISNDLVQATPHDQLVGLRAVDTVASGIRYGLELSRYGFSEDRYGRLLEPRTYRRFGNALSYGMKFFPQVPVRTPERYGWVHDLFPR